MDELKSGDTPEALRLRQCLSAVADGEASSEEMASACEAWRGDAQARAHWHACALIGDVLRSDDLAGGATANAAFLASLRRRMADEPVMLAPSVQKAEAPDLARPAVAAGMALPQSVSVRRRHWGPSMAVAAGALTVIGVAAVLRGVAVPETTTLDLAQARTAPALTQGPVRQVEALAAVGGLPAASEADAASAYVRSAEIDRYLNAHRQYAQGAVLGMPGGLRQVAASPTGR